MVHLRRKEGNHGDWLCLEGLNKGSWATPGVDGKMMSRVFEIVIVWWDREEHKGREGSEHGSEKKSKETVGVVERLKLNGGSKESHLHSSSIRCSALEKDLTCQ
jgi:hypothetical protein